MDMHAESATNERSFTNKGIPDFSYTDGCATVTRQVPTFRPSENPTLTSNKSHNVWFGQDFDQGGPADILENY